MGKQKRQRTKTLADGKIVGIKISPSASPPTPSLATSSLVLEKFNLKGCADSYRCFTWGCGDLSDDTSPASCGYSAGDDIASVCLTLTHKWDLSVVYPVVELEGTAEAGDAVEWRVRTHADGSLTELTTGLNVAYLFWEALLYPPPHQCDHVLPRQGAQRAWSPHGGAHLVHNRTARLDITPAPDVVTRVFMVFKGMLDTTMTENASATPVGSGESLGWWTENASETATSVGSNWNTYTSTTAGWDGGFGAVRLWLRAVSFVSNLSNPTASFGCSDDFVVMDGTIFRMLCSVLPPDLAQLEGRVH
ncbi:hypothetical protein C8R43DRAFT_963277 [Mycena crocata]|nr:hypothetical protein C8R43DRAFT_963277 [Mycena crocata]